MKNTVIILFFLFPIFFILYMENFNRYKNQNRCSRNLVTAHYETHNEILQHLLFSNYRTTFSRRTHSK